VSKDAYALAHGSIGGDYEILFNGVELQRYRDATPRVLDGRSIFFCGRHEERKGLDVLIDAFDRLPPDVTAFIGSDGPDTARLRSRTIGDPRFVWLGRLSDADKIAQLRGAALFCAPSLHGESFGVVFIEAMAAGTPVVASSLDGYRNVATHGVDALLCEPGDADQLAVAIIRMLEEPGLADRLRDAGRRRADDFSMTTLAERYAAIYEELAAGSRRGAADAAAEGQWVSRLRAMRHRMMGRSLAG
jgi:phosphatidylinositol alpha-mannosyltransferase